MLLLALSMSFAWPAGNLAFAEGDYVGSESSGPGGAEPTTAVAADAQEVLAGEVAGDEEADAGEAAAGAGDPDAAGADELGQNAALGGGNPEKADGRQEADAAGPADEGGARAEGSAIEPEAEGGDGGQVAEGADGGQAAEGAATSQVVEMSKGPVEAQVAPGGSASAASPGESVTATAKPEKAVSRNAGKGKKAVSSRSKVTATSDRGTEGRFEWVRNVYEEWSKEELVQMVIEGNLFGNEFRKSMTKDEIIIRLVRDLVFFDNLFNGLNGGDGLAFKIFSANARDVQNHSVTVSKRTAFNDRSSAGAYTYQRLSGDENIQIWPDGKVTISHNAEPGFHFVVVGVTESDGTLHSVDFAVNVDEENSADSYEMLPTPTYGTYATGLSGVRAVPSVEQPADLEKKSSDPSKSLPKVGDGKLYLATNLIALVLAASVGMAAYAWRRREIV